MGFVNTANAAIMWDVHMRTTRFYCVLSNNSQSQLLNRQVLSYVRAFGCTAILLSYVTIITYTGI